MNISAAHTLMVHAARFVELTATFEARYGTDYTLKPGSPEDAWTLYHEIFDLQCIIARMLDTTAIDNLQHPHGTWWERRDVPGTKTAEALAYATCHLIACTANFAEYQSATSATEDWSYAMQNTKQVIAGLLHPTALQVASDEQVELQVG